MPKHRKGKMPLALAVRQKSKKSSSDVRKIASKKRVYRHSFGQNQHSRVRDIGQQLMPLAAGLILLMATGGTMAGQGGGGGGGVYGPPSPPPPPPGETNAPKYTVGTQLYWQGTLLYRITSLDYVRRTYHMETTVNGQPYYQDTLWSSVDNSSGWTVAQAY